jgi:Ca2+-binding EF-hand superfamily protein
MIEYARNFAFNLYDTNSDGYIDTIDLFSTLKDFKNNETTLAQAVYRDINDIQKYLVRN